MAVLTKNIPTFFVAIFVCGIICGTLGTIMAALKLKEPLTEEKKKMLRKSHGLHVLEFTVIPPAERELYIFPILGERFLCILFRILGKRHNTLLLVELQCQCCICNDWSYNGVPCAIDCHQVYHPTARFPSLSLFRLSILCLWHPGADTNKERPKRRWNGPTDRIFGFISRWFIICRQWMPTKFYVSTI